MAARSSCRAASSDAFRSAARAEALSREGGACPAEASLREGGPPGEAGRVIDMMGTYRDSAPSYDGANAGDPNQQVSSAALVRESDTGGHNHFVRLRLAIFIHVERLRRVPEPLVLDASVKVPCAV